MHFTLNNALWGCSGRGGEKKVASAEWGEIADRWWNLCERGLGFVNPQDSKLPWCKCAAPCMCLCSLSRTRMHRHRSTLCLQCHPSFSHRYPLSPLSWVSTQDRHKCFVFLWRLTGRSRGDERTPHLPLMRIPKPTGGVNSIMPGATPALAWQPPKQYC